MISLLLTVLLLGTTLTAGTETKDDFKPIKRQAEFNVPPPGAQFAPQQEVPPEFLNYLQQLAEQQQAQLPTAPAQQQQQPQQVLSARAPQQVAPQPQPIFTNFRVAPVPPAQRLSPQAQEQRRLQQEYADRTLREQQQRALQQLFQPAAAQGFRAVPVFAPQPQAQPQQPQQYQYSPEELRSLAEQQYVAYEQPQYIEQPDVQQQVQPQPQAQSQQPKYTYSQLQFGSPATPSATRVRSSGVPPQSQVQPQPSQAFVYSQHPEYYSAGFEQQTPTQPQLPEQYLIETSKPQAVPERVVSIPRPKSQSSQQTQSLYYRTQQIPQQVQPQLTRYVEDNSVRSTTQAPSRSSIYVTKSGQDQKPLYTLGESLQHQFSGVNQIRLPDSRSPSHPLSQTELNSLLQSGFQISSPDSRRSLLSGPTYLRHSSGTSKRHSKRVPSPVPLTEEERQSLAEQGIRNLYKVESAESQDAPVTYVLAIDPNLKNRNKKSS